VVRAPWDHLLATPLLMNITQLFVIYSYNWTDKLGRIAFKLRILCHFFL